MTKSIKKKQGIAAKILCICLLFLVMKMTPNAAQLIMLAVVVMGVICTVKARKKLILFISCIMLFAFNYSICVFYYFGENIWPSDHGYYYYLQYPDLMLRQAEVFYVFWAVIFCFFPSVERDIDKRPLLGNHNTKEGNTYALIALAMMITFVDIAMRLAGRGGLGAVYGYMSILFILAYYHAADNHTLNNCISAIIILNILIVFSGGSRGDAICFAMILFANHLRNRMNAAFIVVAVVAGSVFLTGIGLWRGNYDFDLTVFTKAFEFLKRYAFTIDTAYAAESSGLAILKTTEVFSVSGRIDLFVKYIIYTFLGQFLIGPENVNLIIIAYNYFPYSTGGGTLPNYAYFYLGFIGVVLIGVLVLKYFHIIANASRESSGLSRCIAVWIFCNTGSWYLYSPSSLIRGVILLCLGYWLTSKYSFRIRSKETYEWNRSALGGTYY